MLSKEKQLFNLNFQLAHIFNVHEIHVVNHAIYVSCHGKLVEYDPATNWQLFTDELKVNGLKSNKLIKRAKRFHPTEPNLLLAMVKTFIDLNSNDSTESLYV